MNEEPKVCNYLDMPLQHASDNMLKAMRRGITKAKTKDLIDAIRTKVPGINIRTTLISGYPGETEDDHRQMVEWVKETRFDRLGVFTYSHEENTHAHNFEDDVPADVKEARVAEIMEVQEEISREENLKKVGKTFTVLVDRVEGDFFVGRTEFDSPEVDNEVLINKKHYLRVGDFCKVVIEKTEAFDLYGSPVDANE